MKRTLSIAALGVAALLAGSATTASAHHAFAAEFDATAPMTLTGTITKVERVNPHGWIYIDVKGTDGKVANWAVETGSPTALAKAGIRRDSIPIGQSVVITGYRAKDGSNTINGNQIKFPDGRDLNLASSGTGAPSDRGRSGGAANAPR
jgi:hypothetical protein